MRPIRLVIATAMACLTANLGHAAEDGIYIGAASGQVETDDVVGLGEAYDDQDTLSKFILGWRPIDWFAVEASYFDLGDVVLSQSAPGLPAFTLEQEGWNVFGVFLLEIAAFDLYAKAGMVNSRADLTQSIGGGQASSVDQDTDFAWGGGAQVRFRKLAARIEYEVFEISNGHSFDPPRMISLGITWTF